MLRILIQISGTLMAQSSWHRINHHVIWDKISTQTGTAGINQANCVLPNTGQKSGASVGLEAKRCSEKPPCRGMSKQTPAKEEAVRWKNDVSNREWAGSLAVTGAADVETGAGSPNWQRAGIPGAEGTLSCPVLKAQQSPPAPERYPKAQAAWSFSSSHLPGDTYLPLKQASRKYGPCVKSSLSPVIINKV